MWIWWVFLGLLALDAAIFAASWWKYRDERRERRARRVRWED